MNTHKIDQALQVFRNGELKIQNLSNNLLTFGRIESLTILDSQSFRMILKWCASNMGRENIPENLFFASNNLSYILVEVKFEPFLDGFHENGFGEITMSDSEDVYYFYPPGNSNHKYFDVNEVVDMTFEPESVGISEAYIKHLEPEDQAYSLFLNAIIECHILAEKLASCGRFEEVEILKNSVEAMENAVGHCIEELSAQPFDEIIVESVRGMSRIAEMFEVWGNYEDGEILRDAIYLCKCFISEGNPVGLLNKWINEFELCILLAESNGQHSLVEKINRYMNLLEDEEIDKEDLLLVIAECEGLMRGSHENVQLN